MFCVIEWPLSVSGREEGHKGNSYVLPLQVHWLLSISLIVKNHGFPLG